MVWTWVCASGVDLRRKTAVIHQSVIPANNQTVIPAKAGIHGR